MSEIVSKWAGWEWRWLGSNYGNAGIACSQRRGDWDQAKRLLIPTLQSLFAQFDKYIGVANEPPWWDGERTFTSFWAAAAWGADLVASSEYAVVRKGGIGWADLWISDTQVDLYIEAKSGEIGYQAGWDTIYRRMKRCESVQTATTCSGHRPGATIYFAPIRYSPKRVRYCETRNWESDWIGDGTAEAIHPLEIDVFGYYLLNSDNMRFAKPPEGDYAEFRYPGIIVLCRRLLPATNEDIAP